MDSAALGTLIIGLEDTRRDRNTAQSPIDVVVGQPAPSRVAIAVASLLRSAANVLEPRPDVYSRDPLSS